MLSGFALATLLLTSNTAFAQYGIGAGVAAIGEDIHKAGGELEDLLQKDGDDLNYEDISGEVGIYGKIGYKHGLGGFRIVGDAAYIYIQNSRVKLTQFDVSEDTTVSATFEVGTSLIPISAGVEYALPVSSFRPYVGAYPSYMFVNRTFTYVEGEEIKEVENKSAGENEFGLGVEAGAEFSLFNSVTLAVSARYSIANLFTAEDGEDNQGILLVGASLWIGDIIGGGDDSDEDSDDE